MLAVHLPTDLEHRLVRLAKKTGRSKSHYIKQALTSFLEDKEDYLLATQRFEEKNDTVSFDEAKKLIDLGD
ncbi:MAG: ribbon-helix-helix domain-containing protein [Pseudomonadota bacterium]